jgi:hypothetical protein
LLDGPGPGQHRIQCNVAAVGVDLSCHQSSVFARNQRDATERRFNYDDHSQRFVVVIAAGHFELLVSLWIWADRPANQDPSNVVGSESTFPGSLSCVLRPTEAISKVKKLLDSLMRFSRGQPFRAGQDTSCIPSRLNLRLSRGMNYCQGLTTIRGAANPRFPTSEAPHREVRRAVTMRSIHRRVSPVPDLWPGNDSRFARERSVRRCLLRPAR